MSLDLFTDVLSLARAAGEAALTDAVIFPLLALPPVAALLLSAFALFCPRARAPFRRALRPVCALAFGAALTLLLAGDVPLRPALGVWACAALAAYLLALPLALPARRGGRQGQPRAKQARAERKGEKRAARKREGVRPADPAARGGRPADAGEAPFFPEEAPEEAPVCAARPPQEGAPCFSPPSAGGEEGAASLRPAPAMVRCFAEEPPERRPVVVEKDVRLGHIFSTLERLRDLPLSAGDRLEAQKTEELLTVYRAKGALTSAEAETLNDILAALLKMMAKYKM